MVDSTSAFTLLGAVKHTNKAKCLSGGPGLTPERSTSLSVDLPASFAISQVHLTTVKEVNFEEQPCSALSALLGAFGALRMELQQLLPSCRGGRQHFRPAHRYHLHIVYRHHLRLAHQHHKRMVALRHPDRTTLPLSTMRFVLYITREWQYNVHLSVV